MSFCSHHAIRPIDRLIPRAVQEYTAISALRSDLALLRDSFSIGQSLDPITAVLRDWGHVTTAFRRTRNSMYVPATGRQTTECRAKRKTALEVDDWGRADFNSLLISVGVADFRLTSGLLDYEETQPSTHCPGIDSRQFETRRNGICHSLHPQVAFQPRIPR